MRKIVFTGVTIGLEVLIVVHWFVFPENIHLFSIAMAAGIGMSLMALADFVLMFGVLRRDLSDPQQRAELADLGTVEPLWAFATVVQIAFIAAAFVAQVYWIAIILTIGQGAELVSFCYARLRTRGSAPEAQAA